MVAGAKLPYPPCADRLMEASIRPKIPRARWVEANAARRVGSLTSDRIVLAEIAGDQSGQSGR